MLNKDYKNVMTLAFILMMELFGTSSAKKQTVDRLQNYGNNEWSKRIILDFVPMRGRKVWPEFEDQELVPINEVLNGNVGDNHNNKRTINSFFMPMRGRKFFDFIRGGLQKAYNRKKSTFTAMRGKKDDNRYDLNDEVEDELHNVNTGWNKLLTTKRVQ